MGALVRLAAISVWRALDDAPLAREGVTGLGWRTVLYAVSVAARVTYSVMYGISCAALRYANVYRPPRPPRGGWDGDHIVREPDRW
jgi:nucleoside-diphosphate-sugar epimerase